MESYKKWCLENLGAFESVEKFLQVGLCGLAEIFQKASRSDLPYEVLYSISHLLPLFNDQVILACKPNWNHFKPGSYLIRLGLTLTNHLELLLETVVTRCSKKWKNHIIVVVTAIKCFLSYVLLLRHPTHMITPTLDSVNRKEFFQLTYLEENKYVYTLKSSGRVLKSVEKSAESKGWNLQDPLKTREENKMNDRDRHIHLIAEALHIIKPLVSILTFYKFGKASWIPLCCYFLIDKLSMLLHSWKGKRSERCNSELSQRRLCLFLYCLRSPLYEEFLKPLLEYFQRSSLRLIKSLSKMLLNTTSYCNSKDLYVWS